MLNPFPLLYFIGPSRKWRNLLKTFYRNWDLKKKNPTAFLYQSLCKSYCFLLYICLQVNPQHCLSASALWTQPAGAGVVSGRAAGSHAGRRSGQLGGVGREGRALSASIRQGNSEPLLQHCWCWEHTRLSGAWSLELPLVELCRPAVRKVGCELEDGASGRWTGGYTGAYWAAHGSGGLKT